MVKFRCKVSGNVIQFTHEVDIESTRRHPGYEEVIEAPSLDVKAEPLKKVGRPSKVTHSTNEE